MIGREPSTKVQLSAINLCFLLGKLHHGTSFLSKRKVLQYGSKNVSNEGTDELFWSISVRLIEYDFKNKQGRISGVRFDDL